MNFYSTVLSSKNWDTKEWGWKSKKIEWKKNQDFIQISHGKHVYCTVLLTTGIWTPLEKAEVHEFYNKLEKTREGDCKITCMNSSILPQKEFLWMHFILHFLSVLPAAIPWCRDPFALQKLLWWRACWMRGMPPAAHPSHMFSHWAQQDYWGA